MNSRIFYHYRKPREFYTCIHCKQDFPINGKNPPQFTLGFHFYPEQRILYMAWAKPTPGECYNKAFGVRTINDRLDRLIERYPSVSYEHKMPMIIKKNINFYIDKAKRYFKEIGDATDIIYHM